MTKSSYDRQYFEFIIVLHNVILELSKLAELCARLLKQSSKSLDTVYSSIVICKCHYHFEWFYICLVLEFQLDLAYGCGTHAFWLSGCGMVLEGMGIYVYGKYFVDPWLQKGRFIWQLGHERVPHKYHKRQYIPQDCSELCAFDIHFWLTQFLKTFFNRLFSCLIT